VELVTRCEAAGLVRRERDALDQRKVRVLLTRDGSRVVSRIASAHLGELERLARHLKQAARRERA
jgi:DNA-binding MarR family transcriptional regulator